MATQILAPCFGSTGFPISSIKYNPARSRRQRKRVRFATQLTDQYTIASRYCERGMSTSDEGLCNRVHRLRHQVQFENAIVKHHSREETRLRNMDHELCCQFEDAVMVMQYKKAINRLTGDIQRLEDETFNFRMQIIRIKGLHNTAALELETARAAKHPNMTCCMATLVQSLWVMINRVSVTD